ncbi:MAG: hypothetical protein D6775_12120 [Caldilineae bacterium]|nr:MAG: hypothetical protein D6775_12120 [Caldilineae bacterium]
MLVPSGKLGVPRVSVVVRYAGLRLSQISVRSAGSSAGCLNQARSMFIIVDNILTEDEMGGNEGAEEGRFKTGAAGAPGR